MQENDLMAVDFVGKHLQTVAHFANMNVFIQVFQVISDSCGQSYF